MDTDAHAKFGDLPPTGSRNPHPITDAIGAHPIETGIGAAVAGAAIGLAAGAVGGPIVAVVGAAVAAMAGGYAGKGVGELIDPTIADGWLHDHPRPRRGIRPGATSRTNQPAFSPGAIAALAYARDDFQAIGVNLESPVA